MSETIDEAQAAVEAEDVDVVAVITLARFTLGFGLGAVFVVGINRARGSGALFQK